MGEIAAPLEKLSILHIQEVNHEDENHRSATCNNTDVRDRSNDGLITAVAQSHGNLRHHKN